MAFQVFEAESRSILSATTGFIRAAGFSHSLTPARNCTFGCTYCYVPTMRVYGGLRSEDWTHWGQFTTFKSNAAGLLGRQLRSDQVIYCSPLVDPYQPAEETQKAMPAIFEALLQSPPRVFTIQTRGPLIVRDLEGLRQLSRRTDLRVSFSVTTDREDVRRIYEPHCATICDRLQTIATLRDAGIRTFVTLAPILPCMPEQLARLALEASREDIIADPFHVRAVKRHGATTREAAARIAGKRGEPEWMDPQFQAAILERMGDVVRAAGRRFGVGEEGFSWLAN